MKRVLLTSACALLWATQPHAATVTLPLSITVTNPSGTCPDDDGSSGATAGAPNMPAALAAYQDGRTMHALGCKIAGVDYHVGAATNAAFKVPTSANLPAGCSLGGSTVSCPGVNNLAFLGYDMTGKELEIDGTNVTISGNKWKLSSNCLMAINYAPSGTWHIEGNSFDGSGNTVCGGGLAGSFSGMVYNAGGTGNGAVVYMRWNEFLNTPEDTLNFAGVESGSGSMTPHIDFNYWNGQGWTGHPDGIQLTRGNFSAITVLHNTYVNTRLNSDPGIQPLHLEAQLNSNIAGSTTAFNTMVTPGNCKGGNNWPPVTPNACVVNFDFACKNDTSSSEKDTNTGYKIYGNRTDASGAIAAMTTTSSGCFGTSSGTPYPNIDMVSGASATSLARAPVKLKKDMAERKAKLRAQQ